MSERHRTHKIRYRVSAMGSRRADGSIEHHTLIDCDDPPTAEAKGYGDTRGKTDSRSGVPLYNDGSLSEKQDKKQGSIATPLMTVPGSAAGCDLYSLRSPIKMLIEACNQDSHPS